MTIQFSSHNNICTPTHPVQCAAVVVHVAGVLQDLQVVAGERQPDQVARLPVEVVRARRVRRQRVPRTVDLAHAAAAREQHIVCATWNEDYSLN